MILLWNENYEMNLLWKLKLWNDPLWNDLTMKWNYEMMTMKNGDYETLQSQF